RATCRTVRLRECAIRSGSDALQRRRKIHASRPAIRQTSPRRGSPARSHVPALSSPQPYSIYKLPVPEFEQQQLKHLEVIVFASGEVILNQSPDGGIVEITTFFDVLLR